MPKFRTFIVSSLIISNALLGAVAQADTNHPDPVRAKEAASKIESNAWSTRILEVAKEKDQYFFYIHRFSKGNHPSIDILGSYPVKYFTYSATATRNNSFDRQLDKKGNAAMYGTIFGFLGGVIAAWKLPGARGWKANTFVVVPGSVVAGMAGGVWVGESAATSDYRSVEGEIVSKETLLEKFQTQNGSVFVSISSAEEAKILDVLATVAAGKSLDDAAAKMAAK